MLQNTIEEKLIEAMKSKDTVSINVLRGIKTVIKNKSIELGKEITDDIILDIIQKEAKKRKEAISLYENSNRQDLASSEKEELDIIASFLPAQLGEDEIRSIVKDIIGSTPNDKLNQGIIIKEVMSRTKGQADGSIISKIVSEELNK